MRKLLLAVMTVAGCLVFAGPAMAWTYQDCVEVQFNHPDCDQYEKPPVTPPETPPVTPPVVTPPAVTPPSVTPPTPPATPPVVPEEEAPPVETEVIIDVPARPDLPKRNQGEKGKTERRHDRIVPPAAQTQTRTVSSTEGGTLPYTGIPTGLGGLLGAVLMFGGSLLRRRVR